MMLSSFEDNYLTGSASAGLFYFAIKILESLANDEAAENLDFVIDALEA